MPSYLAESNGVGCWISLLLVSHLEDLIFVWVERHDFGRLVRSCWSFAASSADDTIRYSKQSSANRRAVDVTHSSRSYTKNRRGSRTVP